MAGEIWGGPDRDVQFRQQSTGQAERVRGARDSNGIGSDAVDLRNRGQLASLFVSFYAGGKCGKCQEGGEGARKDMRNLGQFEGWFCLFLRRYAESGVAQRIFESA
ncbi:hypothetical protein PG2022B_0398 [Bifidobacterium animalis subsp. animalis]|nr:hypothetical protein PG2022B_0398 [Bifidobacterium animalis subsp. animalis]